MQNLIVTTLAALIVIVATASVVNADDTNVLGYTGQTIVRGSNSTIAGDAIATRTQQTGSYSR